MTVSLPSSSCLMVWLRGPWPADLRAFCAVCLKGDGVFGPAYPASTLSLMWCGHCGASLTERRDALLDPGKCEGRLGASLRSTAQPANS